MDRLPRRDLIILGVFMVIAAPAMAQPVLPKVEIFGGYSVLPGDRSDDFPRVTTSHGAQGTISVNLTDWFGLLADVAVQTSTSRDLGPGFEGLVARTRVTELFAGPRFVVRSAAMNVFAHGLVGWVHGNAGEAFTGFSDTKFGFGGGIGIDVRVLQRLAVRGQFDLIGTFADIVEGNARFGVGIVYGLGRL
jgi:hypothetical protein